MKSIYIKIGNILKTERKNRKLRQCDICREFMISTSAYSYYEHGSRYIPLDLMIKLFKKYNLSLDVLLEIED